MWVVAANRRGVQRWVPSFKVAAALQPAKASGPSGVGAARTMKDLGARVHTWIQANQAVFRSAVTMSELPVDRASLERATREQVAVFEALTGRNQDLSDERIAEASVRELKAELSWFVSDEARSALVAALAAVALTR